MTQLTKSADGWVHAKEIASSCFAEALGHVEWIDDPGTWERTRGRAGYVTCMAVDSDGACEAEAYHWRKIGVESGDFEIAVSLCDEHYLKLGTEEVASE